MLFCNKDLINCFGLSEATYYRRLRELRKKKLFKRKTTGYFMNESEARQIATKLNLHNEFDKYLNKINNKPS